MTKHDSEGWRGYGETFWCMVEWRGAEKGGLWCTSLQVIGLGLYNILAQQLEYPKWNPSADCV